jgi:hypothetical protein
LMKWGMVLIMMVSTPSAFAPRTGAAGPGLWIGSRAL